MTTTDNQNVVEVLLAQHDRIRTMFEEFSTAPLSQQQERFDQLRRFLAVHETAEELVTHPRVRMAEGGNAIVDARLEEETASKKLLATLDGMSLEDADFPARFQELQDAVLAHAEAEEREEFPLLRAEADQKQLEKMAAALIAAEAMAPTHPHPTVGSSMTTNLAAGPIASLIDRTRDAVTGILHRA